jgi:hypothetical protein
VIRCFGYRGPWLSLSTSHGVRSVSGERGREGDSLLSNRTISPSRLMISRCSQREDHRDPFRFGCMSVVK